MAFPDTDLPIIIEAAFGADPAGDPDDWIWTDVSTRLLTKVGEAERLITIRVGRSPLAAEAEPGSCTFWLDSTDGEFTPLNPLSNWWPNVVIDLPMRVSVARATDVVVASGFVDSLVPELTATTDGITCAMRVTLFGVLKRLSKSTTPARSALHHTILGAGPIAFWPLDDGAGSTSAGSGVTGGSAMTVAGTVLFAEAEGPIGGPPELPSMTEGTLSGNVAASSGTSWAFEFLVAPQDDTFDGHIATLRTTTGDFSLWPDFSGLPRGIHFENHAGGNGNLFAAAADPTYLTAWHHVVIKCRDTGGNVDAELWWDGVLDVDAATGVFTACGRPTRLQLSPQFGLGPLDAFFGCAAVYADADDVDAAAHYQAMLAYVAESASDRAARVAAEAGIQISITAGDSVAMDAQPIATSLQILQECERTADAILGESGFGLAWIPTSARYRLPVTQTIDLDSYRTTKGTERQVLAPRYDTEGRIDEWTVTKASGSSAISSTAGARRSGTREANPLDDSWLADLAAWLAHTSAVDTYRWPDSPIDLAANPALIDDWLTVVPGLGRIVRTGTLKPHIQAGSDDIAYGITMQLGRRRWISTFSGVTAKPWDVGVYGVDPGGVVSRYGAATTTLAEDLTAVETDVTVDTAGEPWATTASHPTVFPFNVDIGGLTYSCTAITGASPTYVLTIVRLAADKAHSTGDPVTVTDTGYYGL